MATLSQPASALRVWLEAGVLASEALTPAALETAVAYSPGKSAYRVTTTTNINSQTTSDTGAGLGPKSRWARTT